MSVINQMLKDLEQRTPEQGVMPAAVPVNKNPSTVKIVIISMVVLLTINALGFYIWDLQARAASNELKVSESEPRAIVSKPKQLIPAQQVHAANDTKQELPQQPVVKLAKVAQVLAPQPVLKQNDTSKALAPTQAVEPVAKVESNTSKPPQEELKPLEKVNDKVAPRVTPSVKPSSMSVTRRQLTTKELVSQKLVKAEKAVNSNHITQAEKLFEEVLILEPSHQQARKQLAALWFGRKSYQQAVNLLSQGIAIDKQDSDLRMLKARIQLKQGQHKGAYHTLKALPALEQQDYQVMLANVAQQIEAYDSAITAYQVLIKMQPYSGKWHLGLAIVYDKSSQFTLAEAEYALALSKNDLSNASAEFATQRMQALGE